MGEQPNPWDRLQPQDATSRPTCGVSALVGFSLLTRHPYEPGVTVNEYRQILGCPSIRRGFSLTWLPMRHPILLRRPPQSNCPPDAVPNPDYGPRLESQHEQGGISTLPPPRLAPELPRLPPILHNPYQNPTSSCSEGPRGLSVLSQLPSIFTRTSISPGRWLRQ